MISLSFILPIGSASSILPSEH